MSLIPTQYPYADVNGETSKWNAVHHPINYVVSRQDQQVQVRWVTSPGTVFIRLVGLVASEAVVGHYIQYFSPSGLVYTWQIAVILGDIIGVNTTLAGTEYGGYVNYITTRTNYYIETEVFHVDQTNTYISLGKMRHVMRTDGTVEINVATWLSTKAVYPNYFNYDVINKAMFGEGGRYAIKFIEYYNGKSHIVSDLFKINFWTNSAKQIGEVHGSNMGEYVPTLDDTRPVRAKFQTSFDKVTYFEGYPFSLSFIYSDNIANKFITREEERFDLNGVSLSTLSTNINPAHRFNVNRLMIAESYATDVNTLEVWLESGGDLTINPVESYEQLGVDAYTDGTVFRPYVEEIEIEVGFPNVPVE